MLPSGSFWSYGSTGFWDSSSVCVSTLYPLKTHTRPFLRTIKSTQYAWQTWIADDHFFFLKFQVAVCPLLESQQSSTICFLWGEQKQLSVTKCCVVAHLQPVFVYSYSCCVDKTSETPGLAPCAHLSYRHEYCQHSELPQINVHSLSWNTVKEAATFHLSADI